MFGVESIVQYGLGGIIFSQYWTCMYQKIVKKSKKVVRGTLYEKCTVWYSFHKVYNVTKEFRDFVLRLFIKCTDRYTFFLAPKIEHFLFFLM